MISVLRVCLPVSAVTDNGEVPPGNEKGNKVWAIQRSVAKPEIKLTPGKGLQDLTCSIEDLVGEVVKGNKVRLLALLHFHVVL